MRTGDNCLPNRLCRTAVTMVLVYRLFKISGGRALSLALALEELGRLFLKFHLCASSNLDYCLRKHEDLWYHSQL